MGIYTPATSEPPKKPSKKQKKKRNSLKSNKSKYKYIDDTSDTSSNPDTNSKMETYAGTNIYTPLPQYLELKLESFDLYHEFMMYLLTPDQLCKYGFPMESVDHPGHINLDPHLIRGSTERRCCRCSNIFHVLPGGQYESNTICHFHAKKQLYSGYYPCCNGNYLSEGCLTWQYHVSAESFLHDVKFVKTREKRHLNSVTASTVYAIDCEMCYTTAGLELSKIGVVSLDGLTVYETFVLPENKILDYNTVYSGVTERDLRDVSTTLIDVQTYLLKLINKESILVGHGLENDLKALRLIHGKVVDTSVAFPHKYGDKYKRSLKAIAEEYLNKSIQNSSNGHDCIEDARTCMELMLYKISSDLKLRPQALCINKNVVNKKYTVVNKKYTQISKPFVHNTWQYSCHLSYWDSQWENIPSNFMPKQYYNNYIY